MPTREDEVTAYYKDDTTLVALVPGGIYANGKLGNEGITDVKTAPGVWANGIFNTTVVIRERTPVPTRELTDLRLQTAMVSQVIECQVYSYDPDAVQPILDRIYDLTQGHQFNGTWPAVWVEHSNARQAAELPPGVQVTRDDYQLRWLRRPA